MFVNFYLILTSSTLNVDSLSKELNSGQEMVDRYKTSGNTVYTNTLWQKTSVKMYSSSLGEHKVLLLIKDKD